MMPKCLSQVIRLPLLENQRCWPSGHLLPCLVEWLACCCQFRSDRKIVFFDLGPITGGPLARVNGEQPFDGYRNLAGFDVGLECSREAKSSQAGDEMPFKQHLNLKLTPQHRWLRKVQHQLMRLPWSFGG